MIAVRVTLENGMKKYVKEENPYRHRMFILADTLSDATFYDSKYEFYTAFKL